MFIAEKTFVFISSILLAFFSLTALSLHVSRYNIGYGVVALSYQRVLSLGASKG